MRHPLDNFIAGWLDENAEAFVFLADDENSDSDGVAEVRGELNITSLTRAIIDRFGVVELPEPDSVTEPMDEYQGLAEWKTDLARIGEFDDGDGFIDTELSRLMNVSPGAMRELAAALLAAANRAEAQA